MKQTLLFITRSTASVVLKWAYYAHFQLQMFILWLYHSGFAWFRFWNNLNLICTGWLSSDWLPLANRSFVPETVLRDVSAEWTSVFQTVWASGWQGWILFEIYNMNIHWNNILHRKFTKSRIGPLRAPRLVNEILNNTLNIFLPPH